MAITTLNYNSKLELIKLVRVPSPQASAQDATFGTPSCSLLLECILENKVGAFDGHGEQDSNISSCKRHTSSSVTPLIQPRSILVYALHIAPSLWSQYLEKFDQELQEYHEQWFFLDDILTKLPFLWIVELLGICYMQCVTSGSH